jgi:Leucine-rich repeat (LRR) protein
MFEFTEVEDHILRKYIKNSDYFECLNSIRRVMKSVWANEAPKIINNYTDHGEEHSIRVARFAESLLQVNPYLKFSEQEIFVLFAGIYLHDIGMQCDIAKCPEVKKIAEQLGATFDVEFLDETTNGYSLEEQEQIRKNHHFLSAAWIAYLYKKKNSALDHIKCVSYDLVHDLIDVCIFHSKLPINRCSDFFNDFPSSRKRMIAAILRLADELDIGSSRVKIETVKIFSINPENSVYWWLHSHTVINVINNIIYLKVNLHPADFDLYESIIRDDYISYFKTKNQPILDVLIEQQIPIKFDNNSDVVAHNYAEKFPLKITAVLDKKLQKKDSASQGEKVKHLVIDAYEKKLTKLDLSNRQLTKLPPGIGAHESFAELDLSHNELTKLSSEIGELKNLTILNLSSNTLTKLPSEIGELKNLLILHSSYNQLTKLPSEIRELKSLKALHLNNNKLVQLPLEIGELKNLTTLELSSNPLIQLPFEIRELKNLTTLNLSSNNLTQLSSEIGELKNLTELCLEKNKLTTLPPETSELKKLKKLDLSFNQLTKLQPEIKELKNLTELCLRENKLTKLPPEIGELKNLKKLDLSHNKLTKLPPEIGKLKNLTTLNLSYNQLTKLLPEIRELKKLNELQLFNNRLTNLPLEIGELESLETLNLNENKLTKLPPEIGNLIKLNEVCISDNPLISPLPEILLMGKKAFFTYLRQLKTSEYNH